MANPKGFVISNQQTTTPIKRTQIMYKLTAKAPRSAKAKIMQALFYETATTPLLASLSAFAVIKEIQKPAR
jgi:hypothetical protein